MVLVSDKPMNFIVLNAPIVMVMHFLQTGRKRHTLPGTEEPMTTVELITALFYEVDEQLYGLCTKNPVSTLTHRSIRPFRSHYEGFFATKEACLYSKKSYKGTTFGAKPAVRHPETSRSAPLAQ
jgi:hypothetical protein